MNTKRMNYDTVEIVQVVVKRVVEMQRFRRHRLRQQRRLMASIVDLVQRIARINLLRAGNEWNLALIVAKESIFSQ